MSTLLNSMNQSTQVGQSTPSSVDGEVREGERSEPERTTVATDDGREAPDPEVVGRPVRRRFTAEYKRRVLAEVDRAVGSGAVGRILRREGLYSSQLTTWRKARTNSERTALAPKKRGPKPIAQNPLQAENTQLKREKAQLQKKLHTAELMLDLQKKVSQILGITLPLLTPSDDDEVNS
jgi:transposase-like protein